MFYQPHLLYEKDYDEQVDLFDSIAERIQPLGGVSTAMAPADRSITAQGLGMKNPTRLLMHVPVPWIFVLTYLLGVGLESAHRSTMLRETAAVSVAIGRVLLVVGAVIAGWGLVIFRMARTTTVPGKSSVKLVTWGPYRFTRNPMYVGLALAYLGEAGLLKQCWPVLLLPLTMAYLNWTVIPVEEAKLTEVFRDEYVKYRLRVRRWI